MKKLPGIDFVEFAERLTAHCALHSIAIDELAVARCVAHLTVLSRWNRVMNLVGDLTVRSAVERHYGESLFLAASLPVGSGGVADIGSGAGFPGVGVAALNRGCQVTLVESRQKKAAFLSESTRGWENCRVFAKEARFLDSAATWVCSRGVESSIVIACAQRLACGLALLVSSEDAVALEHMLGEHGFRVRLYPVPWRHSSSLLVASPVDANGGLKQF